MRRRIPQNSIGSQRLNKTPSQPRIPFNPSLNPDETKPVTTQPGAPPDVDGFNVSVFDARPALMGDFNYVVSLNSIAGDTDGDIRPTASGSIGNLLQWFGVVSPQGYRMILRKVVIAGGVSYNPPLEAGPIVISAAGIGGDTPGGGSNMAPSPVGILRIDDQPIPFQAIDSGVEFGFSGEGLTHYPYAPIIWEGYQRVEEGSYVTLDFFDPGVANFWQFSQQTKALFYGNIIATEADALPSLGLTKDPVPVREQEFELFDKAGNRLFRRKAR